MAAGGSDVFTLPRLTVQRTTAMEWFGLMVSGQDTLAMRLDRAVARSPPWCGEPR